MPATPPTVHLIPGVDVQIGTALNYLGKPFTVVRIEPMEPHDSLGSRRIAYDDRGRGVIVYDEYAAVAHS